MAPPVSVGRRRIQLLVGLLIVAALTVFAARSLDWRRVFDAIRSANASWLVAAVLANTGILAFWTGFWRDLLPRGEAVSYWRMFRIASIASAVMNTVPFLAGHASSVVLLVRRGGVTRHGALSVLALDQLGEGLAKVIVFTLVAAVTPIPTVMRAGVLTATVAVAVLLVVLLGLSYRHRVNPEAIPEHASVAQRVRAFAGRWAHALDTLRSPRRSASALASVLWMKAAEAIGIIAVQRSLGVEIPFAGSLLVLAAVLLGTMIPLAPGNLGTYEASVWLAYDYLGVPPTTAVALALVQHACFMLPAVGVGYVLLMVEARSVIASE
jgi:uncharacterized protein (TIRG00374 family)